MQKFLVRISVFFKYSYHAAYMNLFFGGTISVLAPIFTPYFCAEIFKTIANLPTFLCFVFYQKLYKEIKGRNWLLKRGNNFPKCKK